MNYEVIPLRALSDNYVWTIRDAKRAAVVDPGDARPVIDYLEREKLELVAILNTHHHGDHVGGNAGLLARWKVPVFGPHDERIAQVTNRLKEGERVSAMVINIDRKNRAINLSLKAKDLAEEAEAMKKLADEKQASSGTTSLGALLKAKLDVAKTQQ